MVLNTDAPARGGQGGLVRMERRSLADLKPAAYNPRQISPKALEGLGASVREFGLVQPIVWNRSTGNVVGGHQRLKALEAQGVTETDVVVVELDEARERALNLALNSPSIAGEFTEAALPMIRQVLLDLPQLAAAIQMPELQSYLRRTVHLAPTPVTEDEAVEPVADPVTRPGDLWLLGKHRLLCGDSTSAEDVARLMNGEKAALLATDPPYLVDYTGGNHPQSAVNKPGVKDKHWDEYTDPESGVAFFEGYLRQALAHCRPGVPVYQWFATKRHVLVEEAWKRVGLLCHQELIWVKARGVLTRSHFMWQHEPVMYGWVEGHPPANRPPPNETTVWPISQAGQQDGIHPTQKPVEIFARPIRWHTDEGDLCLEPFSGSGTQIVAAEQLGRRCYAMELAPGFVEAAVARWERLTGRKGERVPKAA